MSRNGAVGPGIPPCILEKTRELFPEYEDLDYDELLEHQESVYQSLKGIERESTSRKLNNEHDSRLALDETLARSLQDMENQLEHCCLYESSPEHENDWPSAEELNNILNNNNNVHPEEEEETAATGADHNVDEDDGIDPDNMSYEELQSLGEAMGSESRGLSKKAISKLKTTRFGSSSSRWFFKKQKKKEEEEEEEEEDCAICRMTFKRGERLTVLPCKHHYHPLCIKTWLIKRKNCPLCQREIH